MTRDVYERLHNLAGAKSKHVIGSTGRTRSSGGNSGGRPEVTPATRIATAERDACHRDARRDHRPARKRIKRALSPLSWRTFPPFSRGMRAKLFWLSSEFDLKSRSSAIQATTSS